jgi:hypothetical protein
LNSFTVAASMLAAIAAPPAEPSKLDLQPALASEPPVLPLHDTGFTLPVVNYIAPDGTERRKSGIIAGFQVAPGTLVGVGLFESAKKRRSSGDGLTLEKRSKRAAVGVTLQF